MDDLERFTQTLIAGAALVVVLVAAAIIITMEPSSASQGGRFFVAVGGIVALGFLAGRFQFLEDRRRPLWMEGPGEERYMRMLWLTVGAVAATATLLLGLAYVRGLFD